MAAIIFPFHTQKEGLNKRGVQKKRRRKRYGKKRVQKDLAIKWHSCGCKCCNDFYDDTIRPLDTSHISFGGRHVPVWSFCYQPRCWLCFFPSAMCLDFRRIAFMTLMLTSPTPCRSSQLMSQSFGSVGLLMFGKEQKYISSLLSLGSGFFTGQIAWLGRFLILFDDIPVHPLLTGHWKPSITQHRGQVFLHLASSFMNVSCDKTKYLVLHRGKSCLSQGRLLDFPF